MFCISRQLTNFEIKMAFLQANKIIWCPLSILKNGVFCQALQNDMVSFVHPGKIVWCLLSRVAKKCGVFCSPWQKLPGVFWPWCLLFGSHSPHMSLVLRKPDFCICKNKDADQLRGYCKADQRLCFCYIVQSLPFLNTKFQASSLFCDFTARFVSNLVGNPEDWFSQNAAHMVVWNNYQNHSSFNIYKHP